MALIPIDREKHLHKRLRPLSSFAHAAGMAAVEVVTSELSHVTASYPMFFLKDGDAVKLVALFGLTEGENLFVDSSGTWTGLYLPAVIRCYPFTLGRSAKEGELEVLYEDRSDLLSDDEGEPLFGTEDQPDGPLARAMNLMTQLSGDGILTARIATQLDQLGLLKPTGLNVKRGGANKPLDGLLSVDEPALNALADDKFLELRRSGALTVAYAQLFSMGQLGRLQAKAALKDAGQSYAAFS